MSNLFYYKAFILSNEINEETKQPKIEEVEDAFEMNLVSRCRFYPDGGGTVLLSDGHEISKDIEKVINKKGDKQVHRERVWVQSEVRLLPDDAARFKKLTDRREFENLSALADMVPSTSKDLERETEAILG